MLPNRFPLEIETPKGVIGLLSFDETAGQFNLADACRWEPPADNDYPDPDEEYARDFQDAHGFPPDWREIEEW